MGQVETMAPDGMIHTTPVVMKPGATLNGRVINLPAAPSSRTQQIGGERELKIWDMEQAQRLVGEAREMIEAGKHEESLLKLKEAIKLDEGSPEIYEVQATALECLGQEEKAKEASSKAEAIRTLGPEAIGVGGSRDWRPVSEGGGPPGAGTVADGTMKIMQAAVMVAALSAARSTEEAAESMAGLGELGREADGGIVALLEAKALPAVETALRTYGGEEGQEVLSFLAVDLVRLVSQGSHEALEMGTIESILREALSKGKGGKEMACGLCMAAHNLTSTGQGRNAIRLAGCTEHILRALAEMPEEVQVAQCGISALVAVLCSSRASAGTDSNADGGDGLVSPSSLLQASLRALEGHTSIPVQIQAIRAITITAACDADVSSEVWRGAHGHATEALKAGKLHLGQGDPKLAAAGLGLLGALSRKLGSLREMDVRLTVGALAAMLREPVERQMERNAGTIIEGLQLLTAGVASGAAGDETVGVTLVVVETLRQSAGVSVEIVMGSFVALSRILRHKEARKAAVEEYELLEATVKALELHRGMPQLQGIGLKVLMEVAQAEPAIAAAKGSAAMGEILVAHSDHTGLVRDTIFALFLMGGELGKATTCWEEGLKEKVIAALEVVIKAPGDDDMLRGDAEAVRDNLL